MQGSDVLQLWHVTPNFYDDSFSWTKVEATIYLENDDGSRSIFFNHHDPNHVMRFQFRAIEVLGDDEHWTDE